ncbi:MAG: DUF2218 domain-containing protein [Rhodobacteraceae bacterium]|nr:DUF2218 domain-containing protein [Paracoccaceae bacterium]
MKKSTARLRTEHGKKYLLQMSKHFAHKIDVTYSETHADCPFPNGTATMDADDSGITFGVSAATDELVTQAKSIIESHIVKFAFREKLESLEWDT